MTLTTTFTKDQHPNVNHTGLTRKAQKVFKQSEMRS